MRSGTDFSKDPKFTEARDNKIYFSPVYFRKQSEPYMTVSMAGPRRSTGITVAEVNLKFIWDEISRIRAGRKGYAYVVDLADAVDKSDTVYESHGIKVVVDAVSLPLIDGTRIDFARDGLNESFRYENPNVKHECGCGESFGV